MWWISEAQKRPGNWRIVIAGLFSDTGRVHTVFSPGTPAETPRLHRHVFDNGGARGVSTSRLVDMRCIHTTHIYDYVCRPVDIHLPCILCFFYGPSARFAFAYVLEISRPA